MPYESGPTCEKQFAAMRESFGSSCAVKVTGSAPFEPSSLEPIMDVIKDAPIGVRASVYVFYCEAISNVLHHAYNESDAPPSAWWMATVQVDPSKNHYLFKVADQGRGLSRCVDVCSDQLSASVANSTFRKWSNFFAATECPSSDARGQGMASFVRLVKSYRGSQLTVESNDARCTYSDGGSPQVSIVDAPRPGVSVTLDLPFNILESSQ